MERIRNPKLQAPSTKQYRNSKIKMTNQESKFSRGVKESLPSRLNSPTIAKHKIMNDQTFPCHCEAGEASPLLSLRGAQRRGNLRGKGIATHSFREIPGK